MANAIMTQELAETIAATVKQEVPIVRYINSDLSDKLGEGSGEVVSVLVPGYGEISEGPSFRDPATGQAVGMDIQVDKVTVTVKQVKTGAQLNLLEKSLQMNTFETQVAQPYSAKLAASINKDVFETVLGAAHSSIVGQLTFGELAEAVDYVNTSRVGDGIAGMLAPIARATIVNSGNNKFANPRIGEKLYRGEIGEYNGAEFFVSPDAGAMIYSTATSGVAFAFSGSVAAIADGATQLSLTGVTNVSLVRKGTPIVIGSGDPTVSGSIQSPYTVADMFGNDTGIARTFVALQDAVVTSGAATVNIATVNLITEQADGTIVKQNGAVPNTYYNAGSPVTNTAFVCPLLANTKYYKGAVFASKAAAFASIQPKPYGGNADSAGSSLDGEVNIRVSTIPAGLDGVDRWRIDVLYGTAPLYGNGAVALYCQAI